MGQRLLNLSHVQRPHAADCFLIDGIGALLSAVILGIALPYFRDWIGMPVVALWFLAAIAVIYAGYSFTCRLRIEAFKPRWLKILIVGNTLYCLTSLAFVLFFFEQLKPLGIIYFVLEIAIIAALIMFEIAVLQRH